MLSFDSKWLFSIIANVKHFPPFLSPGATKTLITFYSGLFHLSCSSLQEKPTAFHQLESAAESQSFITEPVGVAGVRKSSEKLSDAEEDSSDKTTESPEATPQRKSLYDLSHLGDNELIVREEKRISISWSRDNSPAPVPAAVPAPTTVATVKPAAVANSASENTLPKQQDEAKDQKSSAPTAVEISQGARKKTSLLPSPIKSSQVKAALAVAPKGDEEASKEPEQKLPSKALLQKIAMKETEPRKK